MWSSHAPSKLGSAQYTVRLLSSNDYSRNSGMNIGMNGNANGDDSPSPSNGVSSGLTSTRNYDIKLISEEIDQIMALQLIKGGTSSINRVESNKLKALVRGLEQAMAMPVDNCPEYLSNVLAGH